MSKKNFIGLFLIVVGIIVGLYVGVYLMFIGGVITVIEQIRADVIITSTLAIGIAKIIFAGLAGWLSAVIFIIPGNIMLHD